MKPCQRVSRATQLLSPLLWILLFANSNAGAAQSLQDQLFERVVAGASCKQTVNNGLICDYKVGNKLAFSIKDAGGTDTVVGFHYSNINDDFYAVYYFDCIVVVPGHAHPRNYDLGYGVFVSPRNGRVYRTRSDCQSAK
jgi:hypothetical protein